MTPPIPLRELQACFEGVIPSVIATVDAAGVPNVSYLSHVVMVDEEHLALSNQFFSKTAANIADNPTAAVLLVDPRDGSQFELEVRFVRSEAEGGVFEQVRRDLDAAAAQAGMAGIMRLRAVDIYRVEALTRIAAEDASDAAGSIPVAGARLELAARAAEALADLADAEAIVEATLDTLAGSFGCEAAMLLHHDPARDVLVTIASRGYPRSGVGSEARMGEGLIGAAAAGRRVVKTSDVSRLRRFAQAIIDSSRDENRTRSIALPGRGDAMSQIGVPMIAQGVLQGVLFAESPRRMAFSQDDEAALTILARQAALAFALAERAASEAPAQPVREAPASLSGPPLRVRHYGFDDSVFIDHDYVIKGVPGRVLVHMLEVFAREGRSEFSNREFRLAPGIRLPDIKDNLETRLLLLRRRLEEKAFPVQLVRTGRGRLSLRLSGQPNIERIG